MSQQLRTLRRMTIHAASACLLASACGGGYAKPTSSPASSQSRSRGMSAQPASTDGESMDSDDQDLYVDSNDPRERIRQLSNSIGQMRQSQGLPFEPGQERVQMAHPEPAPAHESTQAVRPSAPPTCQDTCTIKASICDNAAKICRLAGELGGDEWADEKCDSGKVSCSEAKESCKQCS